MSEPVYDREPGVRSRRGRPTLTPQQQRLADDLHMRAAALRAASDGELSIREAVDLAASQLGLEGPQTVTEHSED